jgi:putative membrane protein (TIGR04086 family)
VSSSGVLDRRTVLAGAVAGLFFALPAAVLQRTVFEDTALAGVMLAVVLFSGALAGFGAARPRPPRPLVHGALAGTVTFLGAEVVYLVAAREVPHPLGLIFGVLLFASLGTIGATVAVYRGAGGAPSGGGR